MKRLVGVMAALAVLAGVAVAEAGPVGGPGRSVATVAAFGSVTYYEEFWGNVEAFEQTGSSITQANFSRFRNQITALAPHVDRTIAFDFPHYLSSSPENSMYGGTGFGGIPAATQHLNVKYSAYVAAENQRLDVKQYWYEPSSLGAAADSRITASGRMRSPSVSATATWITRLSSRRFPGQA